MSEPDALDAWVSDHYLFLRDLGVMNGERLAYVSVLYGRDVENVVQSL